MTLMTSKRGKVLLKVGGWGRGGGRITVDGGLDHQVDGRLDHQVEVKEAHIHSNERGTPSHSCGGAQLGRRGLSLGQL